jgi:hypothetical protein
MNPLLIFWLHKYHDKVHNGRQLAIKVDILSRIMPERAALTIQQQMASLLK